MSDEQIRSRSFLLPNTFISIEIGTGSEVSMIIEGKRLIIEPITEKYTLKARMQDWDGLRYETQEYDWGKPVGKEIW